METTSEHNTLEPNKNARTNAVLVHLSGLLKYFFPLLFIIAPILIWTRNKDDAFVDDHGSQAINFQISMFIYSLIIGFITLVLIIFFLVDFVAFVEMVDRHGDEFASIFSQGWPTWMIWLFLIVVLSIGKFFFEIVVMIVAALRASNGQAYRYPLTIQFLKSK